MAEEKKPKPGEEPVVVAAEPPKETHSHPAIQALIDIKEIQKQLIGVSFFKIISGLEEDNKHRDGLEKLEDSLSLIRSGIEKFIYDNQMDMINAIDTDKVESEEPLIKISSENTKTKEDKKETPKETPKDKSDKKDKTIKESTFRSLLGH